MPQFSNFLPANLNVKPNNREKWGQLLGCANSLAIVEATKKASGLSVFITNNTADAIKFEQEIKFFAGDLDVSVFPDWETLPYDNFSPHEDIISDRLATLAKLPTLSKGILVVPVSTLMHRLAPTSYLSKHSLALNIGDTFDMKAMSDQLMANGYRCVDTVYEHGEYASRGSIMDIFPMGSKQPFRIDLLDDEIETLRSFDPENQRTIEKINVIRLLPAKEFPLDKEGISTFRDRWHAEFPNTEHRDCPIYQDISQGIPPAGIEYYLPLFFEECSSLFDYLPENTLVFSQPGLDSAIEQYWKELHTRYEERNIDRLRPLLAPHKSFLPADNIFSALKNYPRFSLQRDVVEEKPGACNLITAAPEFISINHKSDDPFSELKQLIKKQSGRVLFCAESAGRRESLIEILQKNSIKVKTVNSWNDFIHDDAPLAITIGLLESGLVLPDEKITIIAEPQLFGQRVLQTRRRKKSSADSPENAIKNLTELSLGAPVVHLEHGIGRYRGLETIDAGGESNEFLMLEYADGAKLYVPVSSLDLISRYSATDSDLAPLHKLGSDQWSKARRKAAEKIRDVAAELLDIYAKRAAKPGIRFDHPGDAYETFAASFPFEETPDQQAAIDAVIKDMATPTATDRLVCGDVGFGKTEVAMRAAFVAVHNEKQVAVLVPTTLLAQQHYESFKDRFADWPVKIEVLSRFKTASEQNKVIEELKEGKVDIVVGTHKLLSKDIRYANLGLVIIDEEHRFGVRQKEQLKSIRAEVDILTLTATPIPRTLNMSMSGMRDLSIIATPPAKRLSVKTFVRQTEKGIIKEAILREIVRGGQVYYLHNEVKDIEKVALELQELLPELRIGIGHGQMRERELEQVMSDFYHKRFNLLLCTTIIETGIDVPNANTIIIDRADKFGLAQLHQLRGRVGRSHHQAYAYLLTPNPKSMTKDAVKRLEAISEAQDLGAGFMLATHDLEIRGAGELLGDDQSGQIQNIGFTLYMDMLERAVSALKEGKTIDLEGDYKEGTEINLRLPALIPDDYLPDVHTRLTLYKRISSAKNDEAIKDLQVEMIDRFGLLPPQVKNLFRVSQLKLISQPLGIEKIEANENGGKLEFNEQPNIDPMLLIELVQKQPATYKLAGATGLRFEEDLTNYDERFQFIENLIDHLSLKR